MPKTELHDRKLKTNIAIFGGVMAFVALIWAITIIKMTG